MPDPGYEGEIGSHDWGGFVSAQAPAPASGLLSQEASVRAAADSHLSTRIDLGGGTASVTSAAVASVDAKLVSVEHALSLRIDAASGEGSVTSAGVAALVQTASAAATSADAHADTVSARAVSISAELTSILASASATLETHINVVSNAGSIVSSNLFQEIADRTSAVSTVRTDMSNAFSNTLSLISVDRAQLVSVSAALETHINAVSAAIGTGSVISAEVQAASAAATSADQHANTVSARAVSISAELVSLINITSNAVSNEISARRSASAALETHINAVSAAGGTTSVTSAKVQTASAAATSADAHANTVSARAVSISAELASLVQIASAAATSADSHANTVSARAVSISAEVASLVQIASAAATSADAHANTVSARAVSISAELVSLLTSVSATLQAAINTVSNADSVHHSAIAAASTAGSIAALSLAIVNDASVSAAIMADVASHLTSALGAFSVRSVGNISTKGLQSVLNALSNRISAGGGTGSVTSDKLSASKYILNTTQTDTDYTLVLGDSNTTVEMNSGVAHNLTVPPNSSVAFPIGAQVVIEQAGAGAVTIVAGSGVTLQGTPLVSNGQYSTILLIKQATNTWLVSNASGALASLSATLHADITSASAVIKTDINSVSAAISTLIVNQIASASAVIKLDAASLAIVNDASVSGAVVNYMSTTEGAGQFHMMTAGQTLSTGTFTKLSGLSLSLGGSNFYRINGQVNYGPAGAGSATAVFQFGMSATQQPKYAALRLMGTNVQTGASAQISTVQYAGDSAISLTPSIMFSTKPGVSGNGYCMFFDGVIQCSTVAAVLECVAATSTLANAGTTILAGSFIQAYRIG